jgi:hypothetical protein
MHTFIIVPFFELNVFTVSAGDHSPSLHIMFEIWNFRIVEFSYYNTHHEVDEDEEVK